MTNPRLSPPRGSADDAGSLTRVVRTTLWLALLPLVAIGLTGVGGFLAVREATEAIIYTREVLRVSREVAMLANERERSIRDFLLTGDSASLKPDVVAQARLRSKLDTLVAIPRDSMQQVRARTLAAAIDRWDREFAQPALAAAPQRGASAGPAGGPTANALFNAVRQHAAEFVAGEELLWAQRVGRDRRITNGIIAAFALEVILLGGIYFRVRRRLIAEAATVIEQRARLERQLEEQAALTADLRRANEELEGFSYAVAHDLRAPLRSVNGFAQMLAEDYGDAVGDEGRDLLQRIRANSARAGTLIDGLLALARMRRGDLRSETVDLAKIARGVVDDLQRAAPERAVDVRIADRVVARGDPRLLAVVMQNLIANAWKFTRPQSRPVIEVGAVQGDGVVAYFVKDNGVGFDAAYAGQLFQTFQRLHREQEFEGTGIGLATVRRIVERHGGRVWAEGHPGRGATFYFSLATSERQGEYGGTSATLHPARRGRRGSHSPGDAGAADEPDRQ